MDLEGIELLEIKATKKKLPNLPYGFFFGATKNEFDLGELLGDRYRFCLVCLHPDTLGFVTLTPSELDPLVRSKRIQYQINLRTGAER